MCCFIWVGQGTCDRGDGVGGEQRDDCAGSL